MSLITDKATALAEFGLLHARKFSLRFQDAPPLIRPIFVVGTVRSATTIVARVLGSHPDVCHPKHAHFELSPEWCDLAGMSIAAPVTGRSCCPSLDASEATEERCRKVRDGFADLNFIEGGRRNSRFLNKSPHLWNKLPFLKAIFPDAHLVVACRDIVNTVDSVKLLWSWAANRFGVRHYLPADPGECWRCIWPDYDKRLEAERTFPGGDVTVLAEYWLRVYERIGEHAKSFQVATLVKHIDLVENPQSVCNSLGQSLDLRGFSYATSKIRQSNSARWRENLSRQEKESLADYLGRRQGDIMGLNYADPRIIEIN